MTQQWLEGNLTSINKSLCPAISYWVPLTAINGAPASPISVHKALLNCGLDVTATQVQFQDGNESPAMAELYKVFKDHPFMRDLVRSSYKHSYRDEARKLIGEDCLCTQELDDCGSEKVVRVTLINQTFHASLLKAIERLTAAKLQLDKFGFESNTATSQASTSQPLCNDEKMLSNKLAILVNGIAIAMGKLGYATYRGKIYTTEALAERKGICTALGLLSKKKQYLVTNVWERLPVITSEKDTAPEQGVGQDLQDENEDEDEEAIFITPVPSTWADCSRKRKRHSNSQGASNAPFRTNAITKYFNKKKSVSQ
ncbi:uncharacterized protein [Montipora capricornis]|uniref:uncharacterized protein n=1 Tax=Montipora capricornis TaxID=246305 RepID=UPI0035F12E03